MSNQHDYCFHEYGEVSTHDVMGFISIKRDCVDVEAVLSIIIASHLIHIYSTAIYSKVSDYFNHSRDYALILDNEKFFDPS